ncbi:SurA N-terminal domain-containing protein [Oceanobacillus massiliensis]|uniref:SurA N-terminal domain-containing protein n=1 Tax=Oceanobacillus massiliensis TaxID=1465765 RepID=UPI0002890760|nr:SurA N-terminal domain-containing protein [Oceanobacillus massiliensis]
MKRILILLTALTIAIILSACNNDKSAEESKNKEANTSEQKQEELEFTEEEKVEDDTSVAVVNGEEIKGEDYNPIYTQVKTTMYQYGQDVSDLPSIQNQTVDILIEQALIKQDAEKAGIKVTEEDAQKELAKIKEESNEEEFAALLEQYQMTEEEFEKQLMDDLTTIKYVDEQFKAEVTDKEVKEYYDQLKEQNQEVGKLEEVEDKIKEVLVNEKQSQQLRAKVDELKENAEVEKTL